MAVGLVVVVQHLVLVGLEEEEEAVEGWAVEAAAAVVEED